MSVEEEIAREIHEYLPGADGEADSRTIAAALSPLLNRVRAEAQVEVLRALSDKYAGFTSEDQIQRLQFTSASAFMAAEAIAIEQNSEGNET